MTACSQALASAIQMPAINGAESKWYAIMTRARNERAVANRLQDRGVEVFLPVVTEMHKWKDRNKRVEIPLFSCYVFLKTALTAEQHHRVCNLDGVFNFVGWRGEGIPIPDEQIEAVHALIAQKLPWCTHPFLKIGQRVRVRGGALDGIEGILQARNGEHTLIISIDAIQRSLAVRVEGYSVEPV